MPSRFSTDYRNLRPYVLEDVRAIVAASSGGTAAGSAAALAAHRLNDTTYHLGQLDPSQATWALTAARQVIAGAGLTGGGTLSGDVTLTVGAGAGITVNADDVALTTPGTLTVSSTNSSTGSHTHAITASSDVGTSPAAALLKSTTGGALTLSSLFVKGSVSLTNNGDLTVAGSGSYAGTDVLFVDSSGGNVGILRVPDSQFALDIAGPARAEYWIGPHAIQLKNVLLLAHYDGRLPYSSNFSGEVNGHMGQVATVTGTIIHRYGKYYKAGQFAAGTTNLINDPRPNPSGASTEWYYNAGTAPTNAVSTNMPEGAVGERVIYYANHQFGWPNAVSVTNAGAYYLTGWIIASTSGTINFYLQRNGGAYDTISNTVALAVTANTWTRFTAGFVATATASSRVVFSGYGANVSICNWQFESANVTPYHDGGLTLASTWTGTAHASTSTRAASYLTYPTAGNMTTGALTIMAWVYVETVPATNQTILRLDGTTSGYIWLRLVAGKPDALRGGGTSAQSANAIAARTWTHLAMTWDGTSTRLYINGVLDDTDTPASAFVGMPTAMYVGGAAGATEMLNGLIDDLCILDRAAPVDEIRSVYESNAPVFAETSSFSFRPTPKGLLWADDEGLWMKATDGDTVLGVYGNDAATKSWGGQTMSAGDLLIGNSSAYAFWDDSAATLSIKGAITADSGSLTGFLTLGSSGGIYQGTGTAASPTTGLKIWNDSGVGRIGAYNAGELQWFNSTTGYLYAGRNATASTAQGADRWGVRIARDGVRLLAEATTSFNQSTSASSIRWIFNSSDDIDATLSTATSYASLYAYNNTSSNIVYSGMTTFVGSGVYTTKDATVYLSAQHYTGSTYRGVDFTLTCVKNTGVTYAYCNADEFQIPKVLKMDEMTAPAAPSANTVVIFARDNGAGKTQLCALFSSGAIQQLAIQP